MKRRPHTWTLPLNVDADGDCQWAYLQLPGRTVTPKDWQQMMRLLELFRPALVQPETARPEGWAYG